MSKEKIREEILKRVLAYNVEFIGINKRLDESGDFMEANQAANQADAKFVDDILAIPGLCVLAANQSLPEVKKEVK